MKRMPVLVVVLLLGLLPAWLSPPSAARAQTETASDLINTVNSLRLSLGLEAYTSDPWLMTYAQEHADYLDSLNYGTHSHSDGTPPWDSGIQENVASGTTGIMTVAIVVYQIWVDEFHMQTMTGYTSGAIGAGITYSADDRQTYYVIDVRPGAETTDASTPLPDAATAPAATAAFIPLLTSTPRADGWIVHTVAAGDTLWSIAISYGSTVNAIRELNYLPADSTDIYVGQELKIIQAALLPTIQAGSDTPAVLGTSTRLPPSSTPSTSLTPSLLPSPSSTLTPASLFNRLPANRVTGAYILLAVGVVGLFLVIRFCFIGPRRW